MAAGDGFFESHEDITSTALARKNSLWTGIQRIPLILEEIDKPVIAKIHGPAVGAGLDMALMCDVRIAAESATMSESYFNAGIVPGDGGAYFLPRLVGRDKALDMFWTAKVLNGTEAERIGLVTLAVPDDQLDDYVEAYLQDSESRSRRCALQNVRFIKVSRHVARISRYGFLFGEL